MSDYPAGTVAVATVQGRPNVRVCRIKTSVNCEVWYSVDPIGGSDYHWHGDEVADVRPLVVLDLDDAPWVGPGTIPDLLRDLAKRDIYRDISSQRANATNWLADQIEAQTKPPRIPEPGQFGVVEAAAKRSPGRHKWVRQGELWWNGSTWNTWNSLIDPTLIREGLS